MSAKSIEWYRNAVKLWTYITGDPPLEETTVKYQALYRHALAMRRGRSKISRTSPNTLRSRLRAIQTLLDAAGPAGPRDRQGKASSRGRPTSSRRGGEAAAHDPAAIPTASFRRRGRDGLAADNGHQAAGMVEGPVDRRLQYGAMTQDVIHDVDERGRLAGPLSSASRRQLKSRRPVILPLNRFAMDALCGIRTNRELAFPLPGGVGSPTDSDFYRQLHRLETAAGVPRGEHFGLHAIRRTAATALAAHSVQAAQLTLGHKSPMTTINSYIDPASIVGPSLDAMPQPFNTATL